jgi:hypothetical protein
MIGGILDILIHSPAPRPAPWLGLEGLRDGGLFGAGPALAMNEGKMMAP